MEARMYAAYGDRVAITIDIARAGYAGEVIEADLPWYFLGSRFYVPWLRHFLSPDALSPFGAGGFNRYSYCAGDPVNRIDPSGNEWVDWLRVALGAVAAVVATAVTLGAATPVTTLAVVGVVADVVSVAVSIGAAVTMGLGDEKAGGILGLVALGAGMASVGLGAAANSAAKAGGRRMSSARSGMRDVGSARSVPVSVPHQMTTPWVPYGYEKSSNVNHATRVTIYKGIGTAEDAALGRRVNMDLQTMRPRIVPKWHQYPNANHGINYSVDTEVYGFDINALIKRGIPADGKPITVLSGTHGKPSGRNWTQSGVRLSGEGKFFLQDLSGRRDIAKSKNLSPKDVSIEHLAFTDQEGFKRLIQRDGHIVHAYCFSAADEVLTNTLNIPEVSVFRI